MDHHSDPRLAEVVRRFGRHALTDPVALRSALNQSANALTPAEIDALVAAAGEPGRASGDTRDTRTAAPLLDPAAAERRLTWSGPRQRPPTRELPSRRRRTWLITGAVVLVVAAVAAAVVVFVRDQTQPAAPPPDRYALDQVESRYRALGARLLDGAVRCAQQPAEPGELERVGCDAGLHSLTLVTYDVAGRLAESRKLAEDPTAVRSAASAGPNAAFAMRELPSGESTVYWDVDSPRPVSATLVAPGTGLPALAKFYDTRQFGVLERPEVPGAAFASGALWDFAQSHVLNEPSAECVTVPATTGTAETVKCPTADGAMLVFNTAADRAALTGLRAENAADGGVVPGSVEVRTWNRLGGPTVGQFIRFVTADDFSPTIYFDDDARLVYGLFFGAPGSSPDALVQRWERGAT
ncbi:hypothetical protein [Amycolatopsis magusensis]|uniref:Uncharacterized protein n=1 Tax=Amycolatopsis magusensis TaxID=882444 RepID=A0ABS4PXV9_9PSEU|nr:hypothetical protein [Amycolatopsis magusensis]MBP2184267.1 hypothetical protein [Amycolatopsis magusensis]